MDIPTKRMKECIFCLTENDSKSIEHIVPESFGNKKYVMELGTVCDTCNSKFSKFEKVALSNSIFVMERARLGKPSKKGNPAKGKLEEFEITGDSEFTPQKVVMGGLTKDSIKDYDPASGIFTVTIPSFDKSEVSTSKMLLKIGLESIFKSQRKRIYNNNKFDDLREFLLGSQSKDWPFLVTDHQVGKFASIPRFNDKFELSKIPCILQYQLVSGNVILRFTYGAISMLINLSNRDLEWTEVYLQEDPNATLHPDHFKAKLEKSRNSKLNKGDLENFPGA